MRTLCAYVLWGAVKAAVDPHDILSHDEAGNHLFGDETDRGEDWLMSWVEGAQEFFGEVEGEL